MTGPAAALPHVCGLLNAVIAGMLVAALVAVRRGRIEAHQRLMLWTIAVGIVFLALYGLQWLVLGHRRFPGDDWVRVAFLLVLGTHELLALVVVPLIVRAVWLARRGRFEAHRRLVRLTYPVWMYVAVTGVVIYWMNNHLRPR